MQQLVKRFLHLESASGILLFIMAILAMIWANSPFAKSYFNTLDLFLYTVNDGLMALFFLLVGLELRRHLNESTHSKQLSLPFYGAIGGIIVPAFIYGLFNGHDPIAIKGWAIPTPTDIAFALGLLSLFGKRIPLGLKVFLLALAIYDDLAAILIIAIFYSHGLSLSWLFASLAVVLGLLVLNYFKRRILYIYLLCGFVLWFCILKSGVHPTISGVLLAFLVPNEARNSPAKRLEDGLHPWVAFMVMPLFALLNAGFSLNAVTLDTLYEPVVLGTLLGLFVGKQVGVMLGAWIATRAKLAILPPDISWFGLYAIALICGIGFTMSLFLGTLSFQNHDIFLAEVRLGVTLGSLLSGIVGALVLLMFTRKILRKE